jgi:hypothetical protein
MIICRLFIFLTLCLTVEIVVAEDVLQQIQNQLSQANIVSGEFQQEKQLKFLKKPLVSNGDFTYQQKLGLVWKTKAPFASTLLLSETRLISNQIEREIPIGFGRIFASVLGGDIQQLDQDFIINGQLKNQSWDLILNPKKQALSKAIVMLKLVGDTELRLLEIHEVNGNVARIQFDKITHPTELSPQQVADFEPLLP